MTLAEKLRREGEIRGRQEGEIRGRQEGLLDAIELGMTLKFPDHVATVMATVADIKDPDTLKKITQALKTARDVAEILALAQTR